MQKLSHAVFIRNGKIFTVKRADFPFKGIYSLPGGRVEKESSKEALKRELKEELGVDVIVEENLGEILYYVGPLEWLVIYYKTTIPEKLELDKEEVEKVKWMEINEFCDHLLDNGICKKGVEKLRHLLNKIND